jgi:hypothetical protein
LEIKKFGVMMNRIFYIIVFLSLLVFVKSVNCQTFTVSEVDAANYPSVIANFSAMSVLGQPYFNLTPNDFIVRENGLSIPPELVELFCSNEAPYNVVLVVDKSSSMSESVEGEIKWNWVVDGVKTFVNNIPLGDSSKIALVSFSGNSKLLCDLTNNKKEVLDSLSKVSEIYGGTNFNTAFFGPNASAIDILKNTSPYYRRAIVFLSDGEHEQKTEILHIDEIIKQLNYYNIQLFAITLLSQKSEDLASMAKKTGGYYDFVDTKSQLNDLYKSFAESLKYRQQCVLKWPSPEICDDNGTFRQVDITFKIQDKSVTKDYRAPYSSIVSIQSDNSSYDFGDPDIGKYEDRVITITPRLRNFTAQNIEIVPPGYFQIIDWGDGIGNPPNYDFIMPVDVPRNITVRFTPSGIKKYRQGTLLLEGIPCQKIIPLVGGLQKINIEQPLMGEVFSTCDSIDIIWSGVDKKDEVDLYYSIDDGAIWNLIVQKVTGLSYRWKSPAMNIKLKLRAQISDKWAYDFADSFGSNTDEHSTSIAVQPNGLYYFVSGYYNNSTTIGSQALTSNGKEDIFLSKFDSDGNFIWALSGGSTNFNDQAYGVTVDNDGYSYVTGITYNGVRFGANGPILPYDNTPYLFIAKFSPTGQYVNSRYLGAVIDYLDFKAQGRKIKFEYNLGELPKIYVEGLYTGDYKDIILDVNLPPTNTPEAFTAVFNTNLELTELYFGQIGVQGYSSLSANFGANVIYSTDSYTGSKTFDKFKVTSNGLNDFYVTKYSKNITSYDLSDEFIIAQPELKFQTNIYNFKDVRWGDSVDITMSKYLYNPTAMPIKITGYEIDAIAGSDTKYDFTLLSNLINTVVLPYDSIDVIMRFKPNYLGKRDAWINIFGECINPTRMDLIGNGICAGTPMDTVFFGSQNLNKPKTDTIKCIFKNESNYKVIVTPKVRGANFTEFSIIIPDYYTVYNGKVTLNPGECLDLYCTFNPKSIGDRTAQINYSVDLPCKNSSTELRGTGISADLGVTSYNWGEKRINGTYSASISIINNSSGKEYIDSIKFENQPVDDSFKFSFDLSNLPKEIPPNGKIDVPVEFLPIQQITYQSNIIVYINARVNPLISTLDGIGILPKMITSWTCGEDIKVGDSTTAYFNIQNTSFSSKLQIKNIDFEKVMIEYSWLDGVNPQDLVLDTNQSIQIPVKYKPQSGGNNLNIIDILADDYDGAFPDEWKLSKQNTECDGLSLPFTNPVDFGSFIVCESDTQNITFDNQSKGISVEIYLSRAGLTGPNPNSFKLIDTKDFTILGNSKQTINVSFEPQNTGLQTAELSIPNSANIPIVISLSGSGKMLNHNTDNKEMSFNPGDLFTLPVISNIPSLKNKVVNDIKLRINYNPVVINYIDNSLKTDIPTNSSLNEYWQWNNPVFSNGVLEITGTGKLIDNQNIKVFSLDFIALLNDIHQTDVTIVTDYSCNSNLDSLTLIKINNICFNDNRIIFESSAAKFVLKDVNPNPVNSIGKINFGLGFETHASIILINSLGEIITKLVDTKLSGGYYSVDLNTNLLSSGVYFIKMNAGPFIQTNRILITK